jgi:hypothetical protein
MTILFDVAYYLWMLFIGFLAYVTFSDAKERNSLAKEDIWLCMAALSPFYLIDVVLNLTLMTVILWEVPKWKEWTITQRSSRHCHYGAGRNRKIGKAICQFLNKFQRGGHCRP